MQEYMLILIIIGAIIIAIDIHKTKKLKNKKIQTQNTETEDKTNHAETQIADETSYKGCYQKRYLFTKNEYYEFKKLAEYASKKEMTVCAKVRLLDLIEPIKTQKNYQTLFYKIQAKHIDFVIMDKNYYVKAIIELDDNSHNSHDRMLRDQFVDEILTDVGYKVIRTKSITEEIVNNIAAEQ